MVPVGYGTRLQSLGFHFQVHLSVAVGGLQRDVAQPGPDGVDVDPGAEKVHCRGVTNRVRADSLMLKGWGRSRRLGGRTFDQRVNAKTGDPLTTDVEEYRRVVGRGESRAEKDLQDLDGV